MNSPVAEDSEKEYKKKLATMVKRIKGLGMDNPVVKGVVQEKSEEQNREKYQEKWMPVERLVREAHEQYFEGDLQFSKAVVYLAGALFKLAGQRAPDEKEEKKS